MDVSGHAIFKATTVPDKADDLEYDIGNLMATDSQPMDPRPFKSKGTRETFLASLSRDNIQLLVNRIFDLPAEVSDAGALVRMYFIPDNAYLNTGCGGDGKKDGGIHICYEDCDLLWGDRVCINKKNIYMYFEFTCFCCCVFYFCLFFSPEEDLSTSLTLFLPPALCSCSYWAGNRPALTMACVSMFIISFPPPKRNQLFPAILSRVQNCLNQLHRCQEKSQFPQLVR